MYHSLQGLLYNLYCTCDLLVFEQESLKFSSLTYLKIGFEKGAAKCTKTGTVGRNVCEDFHRENSGAVKFKLALKVLPFTVIFYLSSVQKS